MRPIRLRTIEKSELDDWVTGKLEEEIKSFKNTSATFDFYSFEFDTEDDFNDTLGLFKTSIKVSDEEHIGIDVKMTYSDCVGFRDYLDMLIKEHNRNHEK